MHTLLDLRGAIPSFIHISEGKLHDVHALDLLIPEAGAIYVMDRAYVDFERLHVLHLAGSFFVTRAKSNMDFHRRYSAPTDRSNGVICDQTIALDGFYSQQHYPEHLRRIRFKDAESGKTLVFLTNNFMLPAVTICALYKSRWQVELFFKWIKQHLRIKRFFGTSENAVKSQIWIAVSGLRARGHRQEAPQPRRFALYPATDSVRHLVRENAIATSPCRRRPDRGKPHAQ